MTDSSKHTRKVVIALIISVLTLIGAMWLIGVFGGSETSAELWRILCDSFFTVGLFFTSAALLTSAAKSGTYNFFTYNGKMLTSIIIPSRRAKPRTPYHEYIADKAELRKAWRTGYLYIIGVSYYAVGLIFLVLFYNAIG